MPTPQDAEKATENFLSRIHVNGWVLAGALIVANLLGVFTHW